MSCRRYFPEEDTDDYEPAEDTDRGDDESDREDDGSH